MPLPFQVLNFRADLANGIIVGHVIHHFDSSFPLHFVYNLNSQEDRWNNWKVIQEFLRKKNLQVSDETIQQITTFQEESARKMLFQIYEHFTGNKVQFKKWKNKALMLQ